jgi:hypothetical protein
MDGKKNHCITLFHKIFEVLCLLVFGIIFLGLVTFARRLIYLGQRHKGPLVLDERSKGPMGRKEGRKEIVGDFSSTRR